MSQLRSQAVGSNQFLQTPLTISSPTAPQFRVSDGADAMFTVGANATTVALRASKPIEILNPTLITPHILEPRVQQLVTAYLGAASVVLDARSVGAIIRISGGAPTDPYNIVLPSAATILSRNSGISAGDTILMNLVNDTPSTAYLVAAGAPTDTVGPANVGVNVAFSPYSSAQLLCHFVTVGLTPSVQYFLANGGTGSVAPLTRAADVSAFPLVGAAYSLYCADDTGALYRYGTQTILGYNWTVGTGGDFATLALCIASPLVLDGHKILLLNEIHVQTATLTINKSLSIIGETGAAIVNDASAFEPLINITADNVALCNMRIVDFNVTSGTSSAVNVAATHLGTIIDTCTVGFVDFGVIMRADGVWKIANSSFTYNGIAGNPAFAISVVSSEGDNFVTNCVFGNASPITPTFVAISITEGAAAMNLVVSGCSNTGSIHRFCHIDEFAGPGVIDLFFRNNTVTEVDAFAYMSGLIANFMDVIGQLVATGNTFTNAHERGLFAIDSAGGPIAYRTAPLPIHATANVPGIITVAAGWAIAVGSSGSLCNYNTATIVPAAAVTQDAVIPVFPIAPASPTATSTTITGYLRLAGPANLKETRLLTVVQELVNIDLATIARAGSTIVFKNRQALIESIDYSITLESGVTRITWMGPVAPGGGEALVLGDRISVIYQQLR